MPAEEPTNSTTAPPVRRLSATQSAGIACPPVPPPAIKTRGASLLAARPLLSGSDLTRSLAVLRDAVEDPDGEEADDHARAAVADEGERHSGQREGPHGRSDIETRLDGEHRGESRRQAPGQDGRGV